jgi:hypothetical protein
MYGSNKSSIIIIIIIKTQYNLCCVFKSVPWFGIEINIVRKNVSCDTSVLMKYVLFCFYVLIFSKYNFISMKANILKKSKWSMF